MMDPAATDPQMREARMLAAIVFTDVVGFSKLAAQNEARVYVALQRDMAVMTSLCQSHGGQVLNTMGDGMLLCFSSAVDALSCAIEIQRTLFSQSHSLPQTDILHHRIGVHLGDVIMNGDNVFGDGVNVAARLQAMAKPDSVCYSSTVHDVVKNKLKIDAKYLGPQQLKNLGEPVRVWQVPPLDEGRVFVESLDTGVPVVAPHEAGASGAKAAILIVASLVLIALLVFGFTRMHKPDLRADDKSSPGIGHNKLVDRLKNEIKIAEGRDDPAKPGVDNSPKAKELHQEIDGYRKGYQFDKIIELLDQNGDKIQTEKAKYDTYKELAELDGYLKSEMAMAKSAEASIPMDQLQTPEGEVKMAAVYQTADGAIHVDPQKGSTVPFATQQYSAWDQIPPQMYADIVAQVTKSPGIGTKPPANAEADLKAFVQEYDCASPSP